MYTGLGMALVSLVPLLHAKLDFMLAAGMVFGIGLYIGFLVLLFTYQRVEIEGDVVRVANMSSLHRWRQFSVHEVDDMRLQLPGLKSNAMALILSLHDSPQRKWREITLGKMVGVDQNASINNALYVAIVDVIRRERPQLPVQNLPGSYCGPLGRP